VGKEIRFLKSKKSAIGAKMHIEATEGSDEAPEEETSPLIELPLDCWRMGADVYMDTECKGSVPPFFDIEPPIFGKGWEHHNAYEDCDYSDPYENPHCPTGNEELNVLMKFMVPGIKRPAIDQIEAKMMEGQDFPIQMFKLIMNVLDSGGERGGPPDDFAEHESHLVPFLKKNMYNSVASDMSESIINMLSNRIKDPLQEELYSALKESLNDYLNMTISHGLEHIIGNTASILISNSIPTLLNRILPSFLFHKLTPAITEILTRALGHTLTPSTIFTLGGNAHDTELQLVPHYAFFYASYFGDYYSAFYRKQTFSS
jgi:hypothetical protein